MCSKALCRLFSQEYRGLFRIWNILLPKLPKIYLLYKNYNHWCFYWNQCPSPPKKPFRWKYIQNILYICIESIIQIILDFILGLYISKDIVVKQEKTSYVSLVLTGTCVKPNLFCTPFKVLNYTCSRPMIHMRVFCPTTIWNLPQLLPMVEILVLYFM